MKTRNVIVALVLAVVVIFFATQFGALTHPVSMTSSNTQLANVVALNKCQQQCLDTVRTLQSPFGSCSNYNPGDGGVCGIYYWTCTNVANDCSRVLAQ